jgi:WD40 repeat protein
VTALCFSPDGASLLSGGYAQVRVRPVAGVAASAVPTDVGATDVRRDGAPRSLPVRLQQVRDFCFHPSGKFLAVAGGEPGAVGGVEVLSWPEGKLLAATPNRRDVVHATAFNGDGSLLAAAGADGEAHLLRLSPIAGGKVLLTPLHQLKAHTAPVLSAAFSPDGRTLLTAGVDRTLRVWDAATGQPQRSFTNHTDAVHCLAFKPAGGAGSAPATAASGSEDRTVRIWQPGIGRMVRIVRGFEGPVLSLVYSRGGERIFCADDTGTISAVDAGSDQVLYSWKAHPGWIYRLALSPDGATLASGDWSGKVRRWDAASGKERP